MCLDLEKRIYIIALSFRIPTCVFSADIPSTQLHLDVDFVDFKGIEDPYAMLCTR